MGYIVTNDDLLALEKLGSYLVDASNGVDTSKHPHYKKAKVGYEISQGDEIHLACLDGGTFRGASVYTGVAYVSLNTKTGDWRRTYGDPLTHTPISLKFTIEYRATPPQYPLSYTPEEFLGDDVYSGVPPKPGDPRPIGFKLTTEFNNYLNGLSIEIYVGNKKLNVNDVARKGEKLKLTITDGKNIFINPYNGAGFDSETGMPIDAGYKYDYSVTDGGRSILINVGNTPKYSYELGLSKVGGVPDPEPEPEPEPIGFKLTTEFNNYLKGLSIVPYLGSVELNVGDVARKGEKLKLTITDGKNIFINPYNGAGFDPGSGMPIDAGYKYDYSVTDGGRSILINVGDSVRYSYDFDLHLVGDVTDPGTGTGTGTNPGTGTGTNPGTGTGTNPGTGTGTGTDPGTGTGTGTDPIPVNSFNKVYKISDEAVKKVLSDPFLITFGGGWVDYNKYLINLFRIPFSVDNYVVGYENVKLKDHTTSIVGYALSSDLLTFDMGSISVKGNKGNLLDYANTVAVLHLPYFTPINIDLEYVIDKTLKIEFVVNSYNSQLTVNIYTSGLPGAIISNTVQLDTKIPFNLDYGDTPTQNRNLGISVSNGVKTPYIEIMKHESILANGVFTIPITDEGVLTEDLGYVEVDNILISGVTGDVKRRIENQLKEGVIL